MVAAIGFEALEDFNEWNSVFVRRSDGSWNYGKISAVGKKKYMITFLSDTRGTISQKIIYIESVIKVLFEDSPIAAKIRKVKNAPDAAPFVHISILGPKMEKLLRMSRILESE